MDKLELEHVAPYLPYKLKGIYNEDVITLSLNGFSTSNEIGYDISLFLRCKIKPILRPLSDLTKEIEIGGMKFIPIELLSEKCRMQQELFGLQNTIDLKVVDYFKLLEWHFDVFGLIEKDLAIDINTLKDENKK